MAIDELLDEHEQSERVRKWLKQNALGLLGGVAFGLLAVYGWFWWRDQGEIKRQKTAEAYNTVVQQLQSGKIDDVKSKLAGLGDTAYATLAALDLAKAQVAAGKRDDAIKTLRAAKQDDPTLGPVVKQRLARLLLDAGKGADALTLVDTLDTPGGLEARGDALFALGRKEQARDAYTKALRELDEAAPQRRLLELKLTQAGGKPPKSDTAS